MNDAATGPRPSPGKGERERFGLVPHPHTLSDDIKGVEVEILQDGNHLLLTFIVQGKSHLAIIERFSPARANDLWKTTCFEMFLAPIGSDAYFEFNFSPSTQWAAYRFDARRTGMRDLSLAVAPRIERDDAGYVVELDLSDLPRAAMRMGLSAVIEETGGTKSYWALAHAPGPPDFHNPDCFIARLPPPTPS